jgi:hypothetical protein
MSETNTTGPAAVFRAHDDRRSTRVSDSTPSEDE